MSTLPTPNVVLGTAILNLTTSRDRPLAQASEVHQLERDVRPQNAYAVASVWFRAFTEKGEAELSFLPVKESPSSTSSLLLNYSISKPAAGVV